MSKQVMGETLLDCWLTYKQGEWDRYYTTVSEWEREEYMRFF
jgi:glutamine synthetase